MKTLLIVIGLMMSLSGCESAGTIEKERELRYSDQTVWEIYQAGYNFGAINVLKHGYLNKNQWVVDSLRLAKILNQP